MWRFRGLRLDCDDFLGDNRDQLGRWLLSDLSEWWHDGGSECRRLGLDLLELSLGLRSRFFRWVHCDLRRRLRGMPDRNVFDDFVLLIDLLLLNLGQRRQIQGNVVCDAIVFIAGGGHRSVVHPGRLGLRGRIWESDFEIVRRKVTVILGKVKIFV